MPFSFVVESTTIEQHLLMTRSTEYMKMQRIGLRKLQQQKMSTHNTKCGDLSYFFKRMCTLFERRIVLKNQLGGLLSVHHVELMRNVQIDFI